MSLETMFPDPQVRALAAAAGKGDIVEIDSLISQGVNVNARGTQNATPLFWAMGNISGFTRLLELGANPNVLYGDGGTIMHWTARASDTTLLKVVLTYGGDPNLLGGDLERMTPPIFDAISGASRVMAINMLLDAGAQIDARNSFGSTPLITAASIAKLDVVELLLTRGANYQLKNNQGVGALDYIADYHGDMTPGSKGARLLEKVENWFAEKGVLLTPKNLTP